MGLDGTILKQCHPRWRQPIGDLLPQSPLRSPRYVGAPVGVAVVREGFLSGSGFGDPFGPPNRF